MVKAAEKLEPCSQVVSIHVFHLKDRNDEPWEVGRQVERGFWSFPFTFPVREAATQRMGVDGVEILMAVEDERTYREEALFAKDLGLS